MQARTSLFALLVLNMCAASHGAFAFDSGSYKPHFVVDPTKPEWSKPPRKPPRQLVKHKPYYKPPYKSQPYAAPVAPEPVGCESIERSFETVDDRDNTFDPAIGCSFHANLGAMAQRRKDLYRGRGTPYSDGERAANIVSEYRAWKFNPPPKSIRAE